MIEGLQPYSDYKESCLPWCPRFPSHWRLFPNRAILKKRKTLVGKDHVKFQLLSLTKAGVIVRDISTGKGKFSSDMGTSQEVRPGDFVFCLFDVPETPRTVGLSQHHGMITSAYTLLEPRNLSQAGSRYVEQFYTAMDDRKLLSPLYSGLRNTIPPQRFLGTKTPVPPADEQAAIVRFLDHANRKIDGFIRAKRKLIGLLNEQKQAIIHRAVTRGLDPNVKLKDSGIPWLGDIPKHWETRRLRFCIKSKLAYGANESAEFDNPDWPRYLRITDFRSDGTLKPDTFRSLPPHIAKDYPVEDGDILFARSGATVGKAFLVRTDTANACYAGYLIRARPRPDFVLPEFLFAYTQSLAFAQWKDEIFSKATIQNIGADKYSNLVVPIPKVEEQTSILAHIAVETRPLNAAIARTERELALMQEYRTRLTADVVTGKLDVRAAAEKLADPTNQPQAGLDESSDNEEVEDEG